MDGSSTKKSTSFETLVIRNIANVNELKAKLQDIIKIGKDYEYDVSNCLKTLIASPDDDVALLTIQAISELVKCEEKREIYSDNDVIIPLLGRLRREERRELTNDSRALIKQCCRALGNLCCDCDTARKNILDADGITVLLKLLERSVKEELTEIQMLVSKCLLNYAIGGAHFTQSVVDTGVIPVMILILEAEFKEEDLDDEIISTCLLMLSIINDNAPEFVFEDDLNSLVLKVLKQTTNIELSELCLDHLQAQADHELAKTFLAREGGIEIVCTRLEELVSKHDAGELSAEDAEVEAVIKQACDLIVIVLTGDEAMPLLYCDGSGPVYHMMVKWLDSKNYHLLTTAVLAMGNFARQDDHCVKMMKDNIFDKMLDIFEYHYKIAVRMQKEPDTAHSIDSGTVTKVQHAALSALRNLTVPPDNKRTAAEQGRAAPILLKALPNIEDHHVAYKLLAAIRMLVDGHESVARELCGDKWALSAVGRWGRAAQFAGAAGEAPRLLAWSARQLSRTRHWGHLVQVDGCISSLVNMLVASHSLMQNEAILALTLLAIESLKKPSPDDQTDSDYEKNFVAQLINSEIGKHVTILIDTNCAKMPVEVAENLLAFLDITSKNNQLAFDYKEAKVHECLKKFSESRTDLNAKLMACITAIISAITDNGKGD